LCASGLLSLYRETNVSYQLFSKEDREAANWLVSSTAPEALVLTAPVHNSFVSNLAGRTIVMGYPGMLWVHGIPYGEVEMAVRNIYKGKANSFYEIKRLGISYIVVGPVERAEMLANEEYFAKSFCSIYTSKNYTIYDVNCLQ
jgi:uncharacterized membrane protein